MSDLLGWVGTVCVLTLTLPQVWRSAVHGQTAGVPASRAWVAIAISLIWLGYGVYGGGPIQIVLNTGTVTLNAVLLATLLRKGEPSPVAPWAALVSVTVVGTVLLGELGGLTAVGVAGAVTGTVVYLPQLLALRGASPADGVSAASIWLQAAGGACFLGYGVLRDETVVWAPNIFVLATTAWTLVLLQQSRTAPSPAEVRVAA